MRILIYIVWILHLSLSVSSQAWLFRLQPEVPTKHINPCKETGLKSCTVAEVNLSALERPGLKIGKCRNMKRTQPMIEHKIRSQENGLSTKSAEYANKKGCQAFITYSNSSMMATVQMPNQRFNLEPCSAFKGCHVWKEEVYDPSHLFAALPKPFSTRSLNLDRNLMDKRNMGLKDNTTIVTFTVKFYFDRAFKDKTDNMHMFFEQVLAFTNQGFLNSKIPVRMEKHSIEETDIKIKNLLPEYRNILEKFCKLKGKTSDKTLGGADVASLMITESGNACGVTWLNAWRLGEPFTVQTKRCALDELTLAHEIGHIFGCVHDRKHTMNNIKIPYKYGFGTYVKNKPLRTIMSYPRNHNDKPINFYSSGKTKYENKDMEGNSASTNCARVITENRFAVAGLSDSHIITQEYDD